MIISNENDRSLFIQKLNKIDLSKGAWQVDAAIYKPSRSKAQNKLLFKWYGEISKQSGDSLENVRNELKFRLGCQILCQNPKNDDFRAFYESLMSMYTYEQCVSAMAFVGVSSLMNVKEFTEYLRQIEFYSVNQGYVLTHPDEFNEAMR